MKIIDGKNAKLGRLASFVAKEAMKGEEIAVVNCKEIIITGNRKDIENKQKERRGKVGTGQQGPKVSRLSYKLVKRAIRGMISNHRKGRGKIAYQKIKCYDSIPKEFIDKEKIAFGKEYSGKHLKVGKISK